MHKENIYWLYWLVNSFLFLFYQLPNKVLRTKKYEILNPVRSWPQSGKTNSCDRALASSEYYGFGTVRFVG